MSRSAWHVLGAGAMGCLFASALHGVGQPVTLLLRQGRREKTLELQVESDGICHSLQLPASDPTDQGYISHLLVTTKAYDVCSALLSIAHRLDQRSQVLVLANGLGFADELSERFAAPAIYYGTTTEGAYRVSASHICHAGRGLTRIGQTGTVQPPDWFSDWARAVQPSEWDPAIDQALWLKLAINCAINPLTALHGCLNGELATGHLATRVAGICDEIIEISAAAGFAVATANLHDTVAEVIAGTAGNRSSMLQDVQAGRHTEIEYITGYLLKIARRCNIAAPLNESMFRSIVQLDR